MAITWNSGPGQGLHSTDTTLEPVWNLIFHFVSPSQLSLSLSLRVNFIFVFGFSFWFSSFFFPLHFQFLCLLTVQIDFTLFVVAVDFGLGKKLSIVAA